MNPNRFRCPACRTRRTSFIKLIEHCREKKHIALGKNPGVPLPTGEIDMELERDQFEEVALAHFVAQRAASAAASAAPGCVTT